ncbi:MAG: hypothetical protein PVJ36_03060 [Nitrospirota bacterium]
MEIRIETNYIPLILAHDDLPDGVQLTRLPFVERRDLDAESIATGVLTFSSGIAASLIASWIYDKIKKFKDRPELSIRINERTIHKITLEEITEIIEREMSISKDND